MSAAEQPARTAAALLVGNELLSGKVHESNLVNLARTLRALGARPEPSRGRVLALALALDPDAEVRAAAAVTTGEHPEVAMAFGSEIAWIPIVQSGSERPAEATVGVEMEGGLVLPATVAPDGIVVLSGLAPGSRVLRVAPARDRGNSSGRGIGWQAER